ncbi:TPA: hypothetical protein QCX53_005749 [Bacillus cereus]|nr:hypothetical protein [Bacillus cereus]
MGGTKYEDPLEYLKNHGVLEVQFSVDMQRAYDNGGVSVPDKPSKPKGLISNVKIIMKIFGVKCKYS